MTARDPVADLRRIAYLLERANEATYRVRAFRSAAAAVAELDRAELARRAAEGTLRSISGVGEATARCVEESLRGEEPAYLRRLLAAGTHDEDSAGAAPVAAAPGTAVRAGDGGQSPSGALRTALRGDCHLHSDWSDGGGAIEEMALAAVELGHEYIVLTDHSPSLKVARGLTAERLRQQLDYVARLNESLPAGFRVLTGIEVDILADGSLDQDPALLARLDLVVGSVHSRLRDPADVMTKRMLTAVANPQLDVLGHCTGRKLATGGGGGGSGRGRAGGSDRAHRSGRARPESSFDAAAVFAACAERDKAVEINCRPDRLDPPTRLLNLAVESGCRFAVDTDAHAPGQLEWQSYGCDRAARCGVTADRVVNTWSDDDLLAWAGSHG